MAFQEALARRTRRAGLSVSNDLILAFETYFELLRKWNRKVSLTSLPVEDLGDEAIDRLLIEPLLAAAHLPAATSVVIDIGTGGGSPAVPLKLASPGISLRMVESKARKAAFLREVVRRLDLAQTEVECCRFETLLVRPYLHEVADVVTMRAVRAEPKTLTGLQALLKPGGSLFLFKSGPTDRNNDLVTPPLFWRDSHALVGALDSHLAVFTKSQTGLEEPDFPNVPRGT